MEIYYRRRTKKAHPPSMEMEQCHQKEAVQGGTTSAVLRPLHHVQMSPSSHRCALLHQETQSMSSEDDGDKSEMKKQIKPGFLYEIDHAYLPPRTPVQLRSIRVAMVCERTEVNVAIRYPSMESLRAFFDYSTRRTHPALDEKFVMGSALANKVLVGSVPEEILAEQKRLFSFWLVSSKGDVVTEKKGSYLSEALKGNGMMRWGIRRQVKYLGRHRETDGIEHNSSSSFVSGVEGSQMELGESFDEKDKIIEEERKGKGDDVGEEKDEGEEEEEVEEEEEEDEEEDDGNKIKEKTNLKRKRYSFRNLSAKKPKIETKTKEKQTQKKKKKSRMRSKEALIQRDPKDRWSAERYKLAEQNLLEVMKSKGATAESPVLRPELRAEARKRIGDTGLLDHLLKHMAGKLAPGGQDRFRRRHNPDGAMEYWLESADLVNIRREAGVTDPYWVPPPGWVPGDSPTQDPICAKELKLLKDDISNIKRELELMATKMQLEEEVSRLRREVEEMSSKKRQEEIEAIKIGARRRSIGQKMDLLVTSLESSKCDSGDSHVSLDKYKEQLKAISDFVKEMEEKIVKATPTPTQTPAAPKRDVEEKASGSEGSLMVAAESKVQGGADEEEKAAKIRRLKSGFRICKPQGTFLWPNMVKDNSNSMMSSSSPHQVLVQVEVPTPPSVSSSTTTAPHLLWPPNYQPPVLKPLAEKRAVTVTVSTVPNNAGPLVDLNAMPLQESNVTRGWESRNGFCCSSSATSEVGNWLALSNLKSAASASGDDSSHG